MLLLDLVKQTLLFAFYSQAADPVLGSLATNTSGYGFYFSGALTSTAIQDALLATIERRRNKDSPVTVCISLK